MVLHDALEQRVNVMLWEPQAPALNDFPVHFKTAPVEERTIAMVTFALLVPLEVLLR